MIVIFDVLGTLFSLDRVRDRFREQGLEEFVMELWLSSLQQSAMASTLAGKYIPFKVLAESTLQQLAAVRKIGMHQIEPLVQSLFDIAPWPDSAPCLQALSRHGHRLIALTNNGHDDTVRLLERSKLLSAFERVFSADDAKACKPHPAAYELVLRTISVGPYDACMISVHGWDILGAESLGISGLYINRLERQWPFPGSPAGFIVTSLNDVTAAVPRLFRRAA